MNVIAKLFLSLVMAIGVCGCTAAPVHKGEITDHFDGVEFKNKIPAKKGFFNIMRLSATYPFKKEKWPKWREITRPVDAVISRNYEGIAATIVNHSTVLIQVDGVNILTDPIFAHRASPFSWAGPKRVVKPAISIAELPPIDVILISHNHYDHLDIDSIIKIRDRAAQATPPTILAGLGNDGLFSKNNIGNSIEMDWGASREIAGLEIEFVETRHGSGRGLTDQMKTLWGGFVVKSDQGNIYFGGDTGYGPHFVETQEKFGQFTVALIPIGAYEPRWFMAPVHLNPEEAVIAHRELNSLQSIAIHHSTFQLTYESIDQPRRDLDDALRKYNVPRANFITPEFGQRIVVTPASS